MKQILQLALLSIFFTGIFLPGCNGQQKKDDKTAIDELMKKELQNQENAKYGNKNPQVQVISNPSAVAALQKSIAQKIKQQESADALANNNTSIWKRYKHSDRSVVPEILAILKSGNSEKRTEAYQQLQKNYDDPESYTIKEQAIIEQILNSVNDPLCEKAAVQLAGYHQLPGYQQCFEKRLLTGKSNEEGRLFYWLSSEATNQNAFNYIETRIRSKKINPADLDQLLNGLEQFAKNGDAGIKKRTGALALFIYQSKMVSDESIDDLKMSAYTSAGAETLLACLFNYGDNKVVPIANDILQRRIRTTGPIKALLRLEGPKHLDKVYAFLKSKEDYFKGLDLVEELDNELLNDELLKTVMQQLGRQDAVEDHVIERIVKFYTGKNAAGYCKNPGALIADKVLAERIKAIYDLGLVSTDQVLEDLLAMKIIEKRPSPAIVSKIAAESKNTPAAFIYSLLEQQGLYQGFDTETDMVPVDYDKLLLQFAAKSKGVLKNMMVWMDVAADQNGEKYQYRITVISNNTAFIATAPDIGDWYDMVTVEALLKKVLENLHSKEQFVPLNTGDQTAQYIFGDPATINALVKKYKLSL